MEKINIVIVDDHQIVRKGLKLLFTTDEKLNVIGDFGNPEEALTFLENTTVDLLLSDFTMPGMSGIELTRKALDKRPDLKVLILTMHLNDNYIKEVIDVGAKGYIIKDSPEEEILEAVKTVAKDELYLNKTVSDMLVKKLMDKKNQGNLEKLTSREKDILKCIVEGLSNKMIGQELFISERTVNAHRYNIMKKLHAKNSADLVRITIENELLEN